MTCHSRKADVGPRAGAVAEGPNADLVRDIVATNGKPPSSPVADAVRRHFPDADDGVCQQIQQAALAVVPAATPDEIALTVLRAFEETPDQRGAVLFVTTVPKKLPQVLRQTRPRSEWPEIEVRPIEVRPPRKPLSKRTRFEVFKRDSFTCQYCGRRPPETILVVDHIQPVAHGGQDDEVNLVTSCEPCNQGKSDRPLGDVMPRPDADLAYLEAQQEVAELRRYILVRDEKNRLQGPVIEQLSQRWCDLMPSYADAYAPDPQQFSRMLVNYDPEEIEKAIAAAARTLSMNKFRGTLRGLVPYVFGILRNMRLEGK